jgi:hypothetical protein
VLARILEDILDERAKLGELSRNAITRMVTWSPRENLETAVMAVKRAAQLRPRNVDRQ